VKKKYVVVVASILVIGFVIGGSRLRAQAHLMGSPGIPLYQLAGSFAGQGFANFGLCLNDDFSLENCSSSATTQITAFIQDFTDQGTADTKGNSCYEFVGSAAPVVPGPQAASIADTISVGVTTSYNPATGSGNTSFTQYAAGPGVSCNGSTLVNTANAPVFGSGTSHFVVSNNGNRMDVAVLTDQDPTNSLAGVVVHAFSVRQTLY
jgi:hypothetical protein